MRRLFLFIIPILIVACSSSTNEEVIPIEDSTISIDTITSQNITYAGFKVSPVKIADTLLHTAEAIKVLENKIDKQVLYSPIESEHPLLVSSYTNALIFTAQRCFDEHRPLVLTPDIIWLAITQGCAIHINQNYKELESKLFKSKKPKTLTLRNDSLNLNGKEWNSLIGTLAKETQKYTTSDYYSFFVPEFSTTNQTITVAYQVTLLNSFSKAFQYVGESGCGIPSIELKGTKDDWIKIQTNLNQLDLIGLTEWKKELIPIIEEFINTYNGNINTSFWQDLYKSMRDYNKHYISGWIIKFFPFIEVMEAEGEYDTIKDMMKYDLQFKNNEFLKGDKYLFSTLSTSDFPSGILDVDIKWNNHFKDTTHLLKVYSGFIGVKQYSDKSLEPVISWALCNSNSKNYKDHDLKWNRLAEMEHNENLWSPTIIEKLTDKASLHDGNSLSTISDKIKNHMDSNSGNIEFVVLANGNITDIKFNGSTKIPTVIDSIIQETNGKWTPALAYNHNVYNMWQEFHRKDSLKLKVNSRITLSW